MNQPLSHCKTPQNFEGGDCLITAIFGVAKIRIINSDLCDLIIGI